MYGTCGLTKKGYLLVEFSLEDQSCQHLTMLFFVCLSCSLGSIDDRTKLSATKPQRWVESVPPWPRTDFKPTPLAFHCRYVHTAGPLVRIEKPARNSSLRLQGR